MKSVEALLAFAPVTSFVAGANVVAGSGAAAKAGADGAHGLTSVYPLLGLGLLACLLASGLYLVSREMQTEQDEGRGNQNAPR